MLVYHYCSLSSLFSMIENNEIWLTSIRSSYDKDEVELSHNIGHEVVQKKLIADCDLFLNQKSNITTDYFCLSCTKKKNESFFHFHSYGDVLFGVRIAFDTTVFDNYIERLQYDINNKNQDQINFNFLNFNKIIYNKNMQIKKFIDTYNESDNALKEFSFYNSPKSKINKLFVFNNTIRIFEPYFKQSTYSAEEEIRLVFDPYIYKLRKSILKQQINNVKKQDLKDENHKNRLNKYKTELSIIENTMNSLFKNVEPKFAMFGRNLRSYYALNIKDLIKDDFIKEIVVGSKSIHNIDHIEKYLKSKHLNIKLIESKLNII